MKLGENNFPLMEAPYTVNDMVLREIGGGVWFWFSISLSVAFFAYVVRKILWEHDRPNPVIVAALFLGFFCLGSAIRAFLAWMQFAYMLNGWPYREWIETWPWFGGSVILNAIGACVCLWLLTPVRWRNWITAGVTAVAVIVPVTVHYWFP